MYHQQERKGEETLKTPCGRHLRLVLVSLREAHIGELDRKSSLLLVSHNLPPVTWELLVFPSCGSGSVKAQALGEEVDKILGKGALDEIEDPRPEY